jgi:hypothetical protein
VENTFLQVSKSNHQQLFFSHIKLLTGIFAYMVSITPVLAHLLANKIQHPV